MRPAGVQEIIVLVAVAAAAFFIVRRLLRSAKGHADCGCGKCGAEEKKTVSADSKGA